MRDQGLGIGYYNPATQSVPMFGGASDGYGILLNGSVMRFNYVVDISGCSSHGVIVNRGYAEILAAITGSGNGGAGVYAHNGSVVNIKNGAPPTISGTRGHLSVDGTTNATWWSTLDAGTPLAVLAEMTMAKEVP
jgi:hypothetical protein